MTEAASSSTPATPGKLKVFLSYARADGAEFTRQLLAGLEASNFAPKMDIHDIAKGEDWEARLGALIAEADTIVFVVTPRSMASERCQWEVSHARALSKRLMPVVAIEVPEAQVPTELRRLNYLFFNKGQPFETPLADLAEALRQDLPWIREHTRLADLATRWDLTGRRDTLLLHGDQLEGANTWRANRKADAPVVTDLQSAFLMASANGERQRLEAQRLAQARAHKSQRRIAWLLFAVGALVLGLLGNVLRQDVAVTAREQSVFTSLAKRAYEERQYERSMRYAMQAYPPEGHLPWHPRSEDTITYLGQSAIYTSLRNTLRISDDVVLRVRWNSNGTRLTVQSNDTSMNRTSVSLWDPENAKRLAVAVSDRNFRAAAEFDSSGDKVLLYSGGNDVIVVRSDSGEQIFKAKLDADQAATATATFSPDGRIIASISADTTVALWNAQSGKLVQTLSGHKGPITTITFSSDGLHLLTTSVDGTTGYWDVDTGTLAHVFRTELGKVEAGIFSPDGARVLTVADSTAQLWDVATARLISTMKSTMAEHHYVRQMYFNADGTRILTVTNTNTPGLWNGNTGAEISLLRGHDEFIKSAAFSPDGKQIVTAGDRTARLWNAEDGKEIAALRGHEEDVYAVTFSRDGSLIATGSGDNTVRIWRAKDGGALNQRIYKAHEHAVYDIQFNPSGTTIATAGSDGTIRLWHSGKLIEDEFQQLRVDRQRLDSMCNSIDDKRNQDVDALIRQCFCLEMLQNNQDFTKGELDDPIFKSVDPKDPIGRNPCMRRGPLSLDYWKRLPQQWRRGAVELIRGSDPSRQSDEQ